MTKTTKLELEIRNTQLAEENVALRAELSRLRVQLEAERNTKAPAAPAPRTKPAYVAPANPHADGMRTLLAKARELTMAGKRCVIRNGALLVS